MLIAYFYNNALAIIANRTKNWAGFVGFALLNAIKLSHKPSCWTFASIYCSLISRLSA